MLHGFRLPAESLSLRSLSGGIGLGCAFGSLHLRGPDCRCGLGGLLGGFIFCGLACRFEFGGSSGRFLLCGHAGLFGGPKRGLELRGLSFRFRLGCPTGGVKLCASSRGFLFCFLTGGLSRIEGGLERGGLRLGLLLRLPASRFELGGLDLGFLLSGAAGGFELRRASGGFLFRGPTGGLGRIEGGLELSGLDLGFFLGPLASSLELGGAARGLGLRVLPVGLGGLERGPYFSSLSLGQLVGFTARRFQFPGAATGLIFGRLPCLLRRGERGLQFLGMTLGFRLNSQASLFQLGGSARGLRLCLLPCDLRGCEGRLELRGLPLRFGFRLLPALLGFLDPPGCLLLGRDPRGLFGPTKLRFEIGCLPCGLSLSGLPGGFRFSGLPGGFLLCYTARRVGLGSPQGLLEFGRAPLGFGRRRPQLLEIRDESVGLFFRLLCRGLCLSGRIFRLESLGLSFSLAPIGFGLFRLFGFFPFELCGALGRLLGCHTGRFELGSPAGGLRLGLSRRFLCLLTLFAQLHSRPCRDRHDGTASDFLG